MIVDAHCHIWERWPYERPVPDPVDDARAESLLARMDAAGVERAVVVCAAIGGNERNVDYAFEAAARHAGRLVVFPDIDCFWHPEHRTPGAAGRLHAALDRWKFRGFTHYLSEAEDGGWLVGDEGQAFFGLAAERGLVASLSAMPHQMEMVCRLAAMFPTMPILCHHYGYLGPRTEQTPDARGLVTAAAAYPNIFMKLSGIGNVAAAGDAFPFNRIQWVGKAVAGAFGPSRLVWGSDWPVSGRWMTYAQTLSIIRDDGPVESEGLPAVLGTTMARLLHDPRIPGC